MSKLFTELQIGSMKLKNRSFMAPMSLGYESEDGTINQTMEDYWLERARGGVGCIILDALSVDPRVPYLGNTLSFRGEDSIESYRKFIDKIHSYGTKVIPQITHPGPESVSAFYGVTPVASSSYINSMGQRTRELKIEEIPNIIDQYASTSYQAKLAGFDGIELHCAHAYMLLGSFLSPMRNKRIDKYGGSLENRARLLIEVIDAIKEKCGREFPLILRISGSERSEEGNSLEDIKHLIPILIDHGVDAFEISGGTQYESPNKIIPCHGERENINLREAREIKKLSSVPVILVGKVLDPKRAMSIIDNEYVDAIVFGRALLSDPHLVNKALEGRFDQIAPCAGCGIGCIGEQINRRPASCVINPFLGKEGSMKIEEAKEKKKIIVVGAGIAGMACARLLAMVGHEVTLFEKEESYGGQLKIASTPPHKQEITKWLVYLSSELERLNVNIKYKHEANLESLRELDSDAIVLATGASEFTPQVEGLDLDKAITSWNLLANKEQIIRGNILVVGGGMVGIESCEYLYHNKRGPMSITMIEMTDRIGAGMIPNNLMPTMKRLASNGVKVMTSTRLLSVSEKGLSVEVNGKVQELRGFTHIVYACGSKSNNSLYNEVKNEYENVFCIGDANSPRQALEAVREAANLAFNI